MLNQNTYTLIMSNSELSYLCLICGQESPELAFCSEKCRSFETTRTRNASEPSFPTTAFIRSLSDFCQLLPLPESIDFNRWTAKPGDKKPKPNNPHSVDDDRPDQILDITEQAFHELEVYEQFFDQTRWLKMQASALFHCSIQVINW